jgi:hypothetical protein
MLVVIKLTNWAKCGPAMDKLKAAWFRPNTWGTTFEQQNPVTIDVIRMTTRD